MDDNQYMYEQRIPQSSTGEKADKRDFIKFGLLFLLLLNQIVFLFWITSEYYNNFIQDFQP